MTNEIDRARLRNKIDRDPEEIRAFCEALLEKAGVALPEDYDAEAAFADLLAIGAVTHDPAAQQPLGRIAMWMFKRLPAIAGRDA